LCNHINIYSTKLAPGKEQRQVFVSLHVTNPWVAQMWGIFRPTGQISCYQGRCSMQLQLSCHSAPQIRLSFYKSTSVFSSPFLCRSVHLLPTPTDLSTSTHVAYACVRVCACACVCVCVCVSVHPSTYTPTHASSKYLSIHLHI
jgi:hypothetical protein